MTRSLRRISFALLLALPVAGAAAREATPPEILQRGIALAREGRIEEAIRQFRRFVEQRPDDADGRFWLGRALLEQGIRSQRPSVEALTQLEAALALDPSRDPIRVLLAQGYGSRVPGLFRPGRALELYSELLGRLPGTTEIRLRLARWLLYSEIRLDRPGTVGRVRQHSAGAMELARSHLEAVLGEVPGASDEAFQAVALLSDAQFRSGDWDAALASFESMLSGFPGREVNRAALHNMIGHCHWRKGDIGRAATAFRKAVDLEPSRRFRYDLSLAYERLGSVALGLPDRYRFRWRPEKPPPEPAALDLEEIAARVGIDKYAGAGPCGWADYDGDERFDLVVCGCNVFCSLYRATDDGFVEATEEAGLGNLEPGFGIAWADFDNDGDPDLYIARNGWNGPAPNSLLRNNGDGTFTDVAEAAGVADPGSSFHAAWFDYDRDGWLDLVVSNGVYLDGSTDQLYRNLGDGSFRNVTAPAGLVAEPSYGTIGVALGDYDDDGWPDIFLHGRMRPNRLFRNNRDGTFTDVARRAGVAGAGEQNGYIALMADLDSDGDLDIFTGSLAEWDEVLAGYEEGYETGPLRNIPRLFRNNGDGTFSDDSLAVGLRYPLGIMAGAVADLDNDGFQDIYLGTGNPDLSRLEPNIFYHNRGGRSFEDLTRSTGLGTLAKGHGITFLDWDGDGDLEMYAELGGFYDGDLARSVFFLNRAGNRNRWLSVRLRQPRLNRDAIGARVTLSAGAWRQVQEVTAGRGFSSTDPPVLHFGLGDIPIVERMEIRWPDGATEVRRDVAVNQQITVHRAAD